MEKISSEDRAYAEEFVKVITGGMKKTYPPGKMKRDAHPKCIGFLKAEFIIEEDLAEDCKVGVFEEGKKFNSLIRLSNASANVQTDKKADARGFAIKLLGVEGERFTEFNSENNSQDFVLISAPAFPFNKMKHFLDASKQGVKHGVKGIFLYLLYTFSFRSILAAKRALGHQSSPLDIQYWSMTPYKLGDKYVKYTLLPRSKYKSTLPHPLTDSYLSENTEKHLSQEDAVFDFCVQFYVNDQVTSLTNNLQIWKESDSPYVKVATVKIPKQQPYTQKRFLFAENISYSPAHSLAQHAPIGAINYARLLVYNAISNYRHNKNDVERKEPNEEDYSNLN